MLKNKNRRKSSKNGFKIQQKWMKSADTWIWETGYKLNEIR